MCPTRSHSRALWPPPFNLGAHLQFACTPMMPQKRLHSLHIKASYALHGWPYATYIAPHLHTHLKSRRWGKRRRPIWWRLPFSIRIGSSWLEREFYKSTKSSRKIFKKISKRLSQIKCLVVSGNIASLKKKKVKIESTSKTSQVMQASLVQKKKTGGWRGGGGGDGRWYFQVYTQAMQGELMALEPGLSCTCQVCNSSIVHLCPVVLFFR